MGAKVLTEVIDNPLRGNQFTATQWQPKGVWTKPHRPGAASLIGCHIQLVEYYTTTLYGQGLRSLRNQV